MDKFTKALAKRVDTLEAVVHNLCQHHQEHATAGDGNAAKPDPETQGRPPILGQRNPASVHHAEAQKENRPTRNSLEWAKPRIEVVGVFFAVIFGCFTAIQWYDAHGNFRIDQRAWMQARGKTQPAGSQIDPWTPMEIVNVGKTAARNLHVVAAWELVKKDQRPTLAYGQHAQVTTAGVLFPTATTDIVFFPAPSISNEDRLSFMAGQAYGVTYGIANWVDIFGAAHWTKFCYRSTAAEGFYAAKACAEYNDTDDK